MFGLAFLYSITVMGGHLVPTATPVPSVHSPAAPQELVLRVRDLPPQLQPGFHRSIATTVPLTRFAHDNGVSVSALHQQGWVSLALALLQKKSKSGLQSITENVALFTSTAMAERYMRTTSSQHPIAVQGLGNAVVAYTGHSGKQNFDQLFFQYGRYVASVKLTYAGPARMDQAIVVARAAYHRLERPD